MVVFRVLLLDDDFADDDEVVYYHSNTLYSVYALSDADENVVERMRYDAYGAATVLDSDFSSDADGASDVENPYAFIGRRWDAESGLMQYRHRYYGSGLGRFVSRDRLDYVDDMSLYAYSGDRAPNMVDPLGLRKKCANSGWLYNALHDHSIVCSWNGSEWEERVDTFRKLIEILKIGRWVPREYMWNHGNYNMDCRAERKSWANWEIWEVYQTYDTCTCRKMPDDPLDAQCWFSRSWTESAPKGGTAERYTDDDVEDYYIESDWAFVEGSEASPTGRSATFTSWIDGRKTIPVNPGGLPDDRPSTGPTPPYLPAPQQTTSGTY